MKKFFAIAIMAIACLSANAQQKAHSWSIQPKLGITSAMTTDDGQDPRIGFTTGAEALYQFNRWFGLSAGLNYSQYGTKEDHWTGEFDYLTIPVLANFYVCHGLALKTGLEFADKVNGGNGVSSSMVSIPMGISYEFDCGIELDSRFNFGVTDVYEHHDAKEVAFLFTVGYKFKFK